MVLNVINVKTGCFRRIKYEFDKVKVIALLYSAI